jgi:uncharacterized RDD family membrane protein YckC
MIRATMAVTAAGSLSPARAEYARDARIARALALIVDTLVFSVIAIVVNNVYGVTHVTGGSPFASVSGFATFTTSTDIGPVWSILLGLAYFTVPEALFGATPGKFAARLRVVRVDGRPLDLRSVVIRNLLKPIDYLPFFYLLGGAVVLLTASSQRLGDLAAGTTVVYRHRALEPGATRSATPSARRVLYALLALALLLTMAFDYFGRPPLVIQGMYNTHQFLMRDVSSYSLGQPRWGFGEVTYPITVATRQDMPVNGGKTCQGSIQLEWGWIEGWNAASAGWECR